jgi:hypothetical protein
MLRTLKVYSSGVSKTIKRYDETGSHEEHQRRGRSDLPLLQRTSSLELIAPQIAAQINASQSSSNKHISTSTVQKRLRESGLHGRIAAKKPLLKDTNNKKGFAWAKKHKQYSLDRVKSVLWFDESKFEIICSNRRVFVRCRVGERMFSACVVPTMKHGRGGVMVGGALLVTLSVMYLEFKAHNKHAHNKHAYNSILQRYTIPSGLRLVGLSFVFQQDNDPKHTPRLCKGYLMKESDGVLHQMIWPPQSPDLNPIEMVWDELDHRVNEKQPTSAQHMWELQDCWKSIPHEAG